MGIVFNLSKWDTSSRSIVFAGAPYLLREVALCITCPERTEQGSKRSSPQRG